MGKRGKSIRRGSCSHNPRIEKRIEKGQWPSRVISSEVPRTLIPNSSSASLASGDNYGGYIFMCNGKTKTDCFKYRVFGLPAARMDVLDNIHPLMKLFLFDFDLKLLYGIFVPASKGEMSVEPTAFGGRFSAQVRFQIYKDCLPLPESVFKPIIRDNYQGSKFRQELSNEHVQNLISLFRPVDMSLSRAVVSPERNGEPSGFGVYSRPGDGVSASCNQDLAGLHVVQEGPPRHSQHIRQIEEPLVHVSHASVAKLHGMNIPPGRAQPQLQQYNSDEAHQGCFPALCEEELYNRYAAVPRNNQVRLVNRNSIAQSHHNFPSQLSTPSLGQDHLSRKPLSAAYWISVANESLQKEMHPPSRQDITVVAPRQIPPIEKREAPIISQHPPTENDDSLSAAVTAVVVQRVFEDVPMHLPTTSSSDPGYWTAVASQDPNQVYSDHSQWQQVASSGVNTENAPTSVVQTGFYSVPETGTNHYVPSTGTTFDYYNYGIMSGANGVPVQHYDSTAHYSSTSAQAYYPTQASNLAAYYSGTTSVHPQAYDTTAAHYYANTVIPAQSHEVAVHYSVATAIPGQAQDQGAYYFPENSYGYSHVPSSSSQAPAYWDPNQNQVGVTQVPAYWDPNHNQVGVTHFPQPIIPSENNISSVGGEQLTAPFLEQQLP